MRRFTLDDLLEFLPAIKYVFTLGWYGALLHLISASDLSPFWKGVMYICWFISGASTLIGYHIHSNDH